MFRNSITKRLISLVLVLVCVASLFTANIVQANAEEKITTQLSVPKKTFLASRELGPFETMLQVGITSGLKQGVLYALVPTIKLIGEKYLGLPADAGLTEIKDKLSEMDGKLDDIKKEVSEGFEKVLNEMDKNDKLRNVKTLISDTETLINDILDFESLSSEEVKEVDLKDMTGAEQAKIIRNKAIEVNKEDVDLLYKNLEKINDYLLTGKIDTDYGSVFDVYYSYMKKQSMFCGEAATKAIPHWDTMKELYSKAAIALTYALDQQLRIIELSKSTPTEEIKQEAIDAAKSALKVIVGGEVDDMDVYTIEYRLEQVNKDSQKFLDAYYKYYEQAEKERTVFINKDTTRIELLDSLGEINIVNAKTYNEFVGKTNFTNEGLTKKVYDAVKACVPIYWCKNNYFLDITKLSYDDFIKNQGAIKKETHGSGSASIDNNASWSQWSDYAFENMILNMKAEQYNTADRLEDCYAQAIVEHLQKNYPSKTLSEYLKDVGFNIKSLNSGQYYFPTSSISLDRELTNFGSNTNALDAGDLEKTLKSVKDCINVDNPHGVLLYFKYKDPAVKIRINTTSMDGRIYYGSYTITGTKCIGINPDGSKRLESYREYLTIHGTSSVCITLPINVDYRSVNITLGYHGVGESSNHDNLCSYSLAERVNPSMVELSQRGYTKWWGGYGVDAKIVVDGREVANGVG